MSNNNLPATSNGNSLEKPQPKTWGDIINERSEEFAKALAGRIPTDLFVSAAITTVNRNDKLRKCSSTSVYAALRDAATLGLIPDNTLQYCFLIPYGTECKFQLGYKGIAHLMRKEAGVQEIDAEVIYEKDDFDWALGTNKFLRHVPSLADDRGERRGAWAMVKGADGQIEFRVLNMKRLKEIRKMSKSSNSDAWTKSEDEMWRKTVLINLSKTQSLSPDIKAIIQRDIESEFDPSEQPAPKPVTNTQKPNIHSSLQDEAQDADHAPVAAADVSEPTNPDGSPLFK